MPTSLQCCGHLLVGPALFDGGGTSNSTGRRSWIPLSSHRRRRFAVSATVKRLQSHYSTLGVSTDASSSDIKKSYRLLALKNHPLSILTTIILQSPMGTSLTPQVLQATAICISDLSVSPSSDSKYHPDVNKEAGANEVFKSIRLAYDTLIDEKKRIQYDLALRYQEYAGESSGNHSTFNSEYEDAQRIYRWAQLRRKMRREKYWEQYHEAYEESEEEEEENTDEERGSFVEVLRSAFLSLFLMQTVGTRLSLTFSSVMALLDPKLDNGYKVGYLFAWLLGGRGGILLTMFLSFASWVCGKTSSSIVAVVVVAMWVGSSLARYAPLPQGAILTLLYMSIKLQSDLS